MSSIDVEARIAKKFFDETAKTCRVEIEDTHHTEEIRDDVGIHDAPSFKTWYDITSEEITINRYNGIGDLIDTITPTRDPETGSLYTTQLALNAQGEPQEAIVSIYVKGQPVIVGTSRPHKENQ